MKAAMRLLGMLLRQRPPKADNDMLAAIYGRKSCRKFSDREIPKDALSKILAAGVCAPSTVNLQTWSFFPFNRIEWRETFGASIPFGAQAAIIVLADLKRLSSVDETFRDYPLFFYTLAVMNASLAAMNMTMAVEALGMKSIMLSQTGKTGLVDIEYLKDKLKLPDMVVPLTTVAFGYPEDPVLFSPPKLNPDAVVHKDGYALDREAVMHWHENMELVCRLVDREKLTEKFDRYLKLLPQAEEELNRAFQKIRR